MLPLYPSMGAYLAADSGRGRGWSGILGALVLAGILTMMLVVGLSLFLLRASFGAVLPWLLPLLASRVQWLFTSWGVGRYALLTRAAGVLPVGIGLFSVWAEILPSLWAPCSVTLLLGMLRRWRQQ